MEKRSALSQQQEQQEKSLFLFAVVVGYIITFIVNSSGGSQLTVLQLVLGILFGVIYLCLVFFEEEILGRFPPRTKYFLFFFIQLTLVLGIGWMLGPGGNWLIGLPLVAVAVEWLSPRSRWYVYIGLLAAIVIPILHYSTWDTALMNAFVISATIFFVAALTQVRINEEQARARAEVLGSDFFTIHHPPVFQALRAKIQQQSHLQPVRLQVIDRLRQVNIFQPAQRFQFHHDFIFHQEIDPPGADLLSLVVNGHLQLSLE